MCTPEAEILQPGAAAQGVLPQDTMTNTVAGFDTSTPAVATPPRAAGTTGQRLSDTPAVVFLTNAAVGHITGLVAFFFTQPGAWGALSEWSGRG